jgi:hypothetical protein
VNAAQLSAWAEANRKPLLAAGAAGAVGLGLLQARRKNPTTGGDPGPLRPAAGGGPSAFSTGPAFAGTVPYDSGAYDSYNDLQNQITRLYDQVEEKAPIPLPVQEGFYRNPADGAIYEVDGKGNRDWLSPKEWASIGKARNYETTPVAADAAWWQATTPVGTQPVPKK